MKLIIVRHEERNTQFGFFENLTDTGLYYAKNIIPNKINKISPKVDYIFSSPYCRTLETIQFYAKEKNLKINVENSLLEYLSNTFYLYNKWRYNWDQINDPKYDYLKKIMNKNYKSLIDINDINTINILESSSELYNRIIFFFNFLKKKYKDTDTIVLSTHKNVINMILYIYKNITNGININDYGKIIILKI
jgi:broad specificity phosphatase PhoE